MPLTEFILSGDPKFLITFIIFSAISIFHFLKKLKNRENEALVNYHNAKINNATYWMLILSVLSLLLGLMHSFYFIGKAGGIAPGLIFQGFAYALITPVFGLILYILGKIQNQLFNYKTTNQV